MIFSRKRRDRNDPTTIFITGHPHVDWTRKLLIHKQMNAIVMDVLSAASTYMYTYTFYKFKFKNAEYTHIKKVLLQIWFFFPLDYIMIYYIQITIHQRNKRLNTTAHSAIPSEPSVDSQLKYSTYLSPLIFVKWLVDGNAFLLFALFVHMQRLPPLLVVVFGQNKGNRRIRYAEWSAAIMYIYVWILGT